MSANVLAGIANSNALPLVMVRLLSPLATVGELLIALATVNLKLVLTAALLPSVAKTATLTSPGVGGVPLNVLVVELKTNQVGND